MLFPSCCSAKKSCLGGLMPFSDNFLVRTTDCDANLKLTTPAMLDLFQESAARHCLKYNLDSPYLIDNKGQTWVLTGMALKITEYPKWPEDVRIDTWAKSFKGFKAYRDYTIYNSNGNRAVEASSIWALLDIKSRRPVKLETLETQMKEEGELSNLPDILPGRPETIDFSSCSETVIEVHKGNLDLNNHVSNIQYIFWLHIYIENSGELELEYINISYKGESYLGDRLIFKSSIEHGKGYHCFINSLTGKDVCVMETHWKNIN